MKLRITFNCFRFTTSSLVNLDKMLGSAFINLVQKGCSLLYYNLHRFACGTMKFFLNIQTLCVPSLLTNILLPTSMDTTAVFCHFKCEAFFSKLQALLNVSIYVSI